MAFSLDSKVKDILKNPEAAAVLDKYSPDASKNPQMKLVRMIIRFCWKNWKKSFRQSNNLQKRSSLQFGDCFFF